MANATTEVHPETGLPVGSPDLLLRAVRSRDQRFDGWFVAGVVSTHIYCRPSCPAVPARADRIRYFPSAAAAQRSGFRACKRCRPDATPGSPEWNVRTDVAARAMRLIADGVVDRQGASGLARQLGYSERQLHRVLVAEVGAGAIVLARNQRASTARTLIERTDLPFVDVAFAAGFGSVRQFNDTIREVFATSPTQLRSAARGRGRVAGAGDAVGAMGEAGIGSLSLRLSARAPFDGVSVLGFLGQRAVAGIEHWDGTTFTRSLSLPGGPGVVGLRVEGSEHAVRATLRLSDLRDLTAAVQRCRCLLDLDADPLAVAEVLGADPLLGDLVSARPGRRSPGAVDGAEQATRAVLGQQVSIAAARALTGQLVAALGSPLPVSLRGPTTHLFPAPGVLAGAALDAFAVTATRRRTIAVVNQTIASGDLRLDPGADRGAAADHLLSLPGVGPWTAAYIRMRALGDPDVFLVTDLGARHALDRLGAGGTPRAIAELSERWRPWRSYALHHLWASLV